MEISITIRVLNPSLKKYSNLKIIRTFIMFVVKSIHTATTKYGYFRFIELIVRF